MNRLSTEKRAQIIGMMVEGISIRARTRSPRSSLMLAMPAPRIGTILCAI